MLIIKESKEKSACAFLAQTLCVLIIKELIFQFLTDVDKIFIFYVV